MLTWVISFKNSFDNSLRISYIFSEIWFLLIIWEFHTVDFGLVHSLPSTVLDLPLSPYHSNFVSFSLLIPIEYYLCLPNILGCGDTPWTVLNLLRITPLKEPNCLFPSSYQFPVTSQLQEGPVPTSVLHAETWLMFCILPQLLQIHRWNCSVVSGKRTFYSHLLSLVLKILLSLLPWLYLSPGSQEEMQISHLGLMILQSIILCMSTSCMALCSLRCAVRSFLSVEDGCT